MKKIYFLFLIIFGIHSLNAQNPELYRTWNLIEINYEQGYPIEINEVEPEVHPYIVFHEDNSFEGHGACTEYSGIAEFPIEDPNRVLFLNVDFPNVDCGNDTWNQIDNTLRSVISTDNYWMWGMGLNPDTQTLEFGIVFGFGDSLRFESAQNPELFGTWYLKEIQIDSSPTIYINEYDPAISPTLTINENMTYEGTGACNSFSGNFYLADEDLFFSNFASTDLDCENQPLNDFEMIYFHLFSGDVHFPLWLWENSQTGDWELWFGSSANISYRFVKSPLMSNQDFPETKMEIYPNPVSDFLFIKNSKTNSDFWLFDLTGKLISKGKINVQNKLDVSVLEKGNYILVIGNERFRFIKE